MDSGITFDQFLEQAMDAMAVTVPWYSYAIVVLLYIIVYLWRPFYLIHLSFAMLYVYLSYNDARHNPKLFWRVIFAFLRLPSFTECLMTGLN